jgi:A/G-specific adenine glycosylase
MNRQTRTEIRTALLRWFPEHARDLPWRRTKDPYAIWVSEIMLQQTRVSTVLPYYERFLKRFPTIGSLARARLDTVLKLWEGLGYYSRARNMHLATKEVVARFNGRMPRTKDELLGSSGFCVLSGLERPEHRGCYPRTPGIFRLLPMAW